MARDAFTHWRNDCLLLPKFLGVNLSHHHLRTLRRLQPERWGRKHDVHTPHELSWPKSLLNWVTGSKTDCTWRRYSWGFLGGPFRSRSDEPEPNSTGSNLGISSSTSDFIVMSVLTCGIQKVHLTIQATRGYAPGSTTAYKFSLIRRDNNHATQDPGGHFCLCRAIMT